MSVSSLRTNTRAAAVALKGDASDLTASQIAAVDKFIADIDAEATGDPGNAMAEKDSVATQLPYELRSALADVPVVSSALTKSGTKNSAISTYTITGTHTPTSFNASHLPPGLAVNTSTGAITGTPTSAGTFRSQIWCANGVTTSQKATLVFTIADA